MSTDFWSVLSQVLSVQTNLVWKDLPWSGVLEAAGKMAWHQHRVSAETQQLGLADPLVWSEILQCQQ